MYHTVRLKCISGISRLFLRLLWVYSYQHACPYKCRAKTLLQWPCCCTEDRFLVVGHFGGTATQELHQRSRCVVPCFQMGLSIKAIHLHWVERASARSRHARPLLVGRETKRCGKILHVAAGLSKQPSARTLHHPSPLGWWWCVPAV